MGTFQARSKPILPDHPHPSSVYGAGISAFFKSLNLLNVHEKYRILIKVPVCTLGCQLHESVTSKVQDCHKRVKREFIVHVIVLLSLLLVFVRASRCVLPAAFTRFILVHCISTLNVRREVVVELEKVLCFEEVPHFPFELHIFLQSS